MATVTSHKPALAIAPPLERPSSARGRTRLQFCTASWEAPREFALFVRGVIRGEVHVHLPLPPRR